jgi:hypothetical protein
MYWLTNVMYVTMLVNTGMMKLVEIKISDRETS